MSAAQRTPSAPEGSANGAGLLTARNVSRAFPGVQALDGVDFGLSGGHVHALLGENGAGKSTLIKVLTGLLVPDAGDVRLDGAPLPLGDPAAIREWGIRAVYQELNLVGPLSVRENICLGAFPRRRFGSIDWEAVDERTAAALRTVGLDVDPLRRVDDLSVAEQQLVEIARALSGAARVLILDEPTSSLSQTESDRLFDVVRQLTAEGVGVVYVTHRLDEVEILADEVTVLRDGKRVLEAEKGSWTRMDVVRAMVGQELAAFQSTHTQAVGRPVLEVRNLSTADGLRVDDLTVHAGEVVGAFGLVGSGLHTLGRAIFGGDPLVTGSVKIDQRERSRHTPRSSRRSGLGFLSEDRKRDGVISELSVRRNATVAALESFATAGWLDRRQEASRARGMVERLRIATPSMSQKMSFLSGGNQQKVLLARWLMTEPEVLMLAEPTRGVDVGAKAEIYRIVDEVTDSGMGILILSTDAEEITTVCDRAVVLRRGTVVAELGRSQLTQQALLGAATGASEEERSRDDL